MNFELMTAQRLTAGIIFPPKNHERQDLAELYALVAGRYDYGGFQMLPDGARMFSPDKECLIQTTRIQVNDAITTHYEFAKQKALDLFQLISEELNITQFLAFGVKLIAHLPFDGEETAAEFIESRFLKVSRGQFDLLGDGRRGTGIRLLLHQDGVYELRIEPLFADTRIMYLEVDIQYPQPFTNLDVLPGRMDAAYSYLFDDLRRFIESVGESD
jgi:hypothetical protein